MWQAPKVLLCPWSYKYFIKLIRDYKKVLQGAVKLPAVEFLKFGIRPNLNVGPSKTTLLVIYDMKPPTYNMNLRILNIEQWFWPLNIGKLAHVGVPGSNPGEAKL